MVGDLFDKKGRTMAAAILATCWGIGGVVGVFAATSSISAGLGWRLPFLIVSIPNFFLIAIFYLVVSEPKKGSQEVGVGDLVEQGLIYPKNISIRDYIKLAKTKTNIVLFLQGIAGCIPWGGMILLIKFLTENKGFDAGNAGFIFIIMGAGSAIGGLSGGYIGGRLFTKKPSLQPIFSGLMTIIGAFACLAVLFVVPAEFIYVAVAGFFGAASASVTGANMRNMLLSVNAPEDRGAIFSIFNLTDSIGIGIGQFFAGSIATVIGTGYALGASFTFWIPCGLLLFVAALYFTKDIDNLDNEMKHLAQKMKIS